MKLQTNLRTENLGPKLSNFEQKSAFKMAYLSNRLLFVELLQKCRKFGFLDSRIQYTQCSGRSNTLMYVMKPQITHQDEKYEILLFWDIFLSFCRFLIFCLFLRIKWNSVKLILYKIFRHIYFNMSMSVSRTFWISWFGSLQKCLKE